VYDLGHHGRMADLARAGHSRRVPLGAIAPERRHQARSRRRRTRLEEREIRTVASQLSRLKPALRRRCDVLDRRSPAAVVHDRQARRARASASRRSARRSAPGCDLHRESSQQFAVVAPNPPSPTVSGAFPTVLGISPEMGPPFAAAAGVESVRFAPVIVLSTSH
jgi:hypothetical protein